MFHIRHPSVECWSHFLTYYRKEGLNLYLVQASSSVKNTKRLSLAHSFDTISHSFADTAGHISTLSDRILRLLLLDRYTEPSQTVTGLALLHDTDTNAQWYSLSIPSGWASGSNFVRAAFIAHSYNLISLTKENCMFSSIIQQSAV